MEERGCLQPRQQNQGFVAEAQTWSTAEPPAAGPGLGEVLTRDLGEQQEEAGVLEGSCFNKALMNLLSRSMAVGVNGAARRHQPNQAPSLLAGAAH